MENHREYTDLKGTTAEPEKPKLPRNFKMGPKRTLRVMGILIAAILLIYIVWMVVGGGEAAAIVNGEKISREALDTRIELVLSSSQSEGIDTSDPAFLKQLEEQVLNELINTALLLQAASMEGIRAERADIDEQYQLIVAQFGNEEVIKDTLKASGISTRALRQNIAEQIIINKFIDEQMESKNVAVTSEEIDAFYNQIRESQTQVPPLEEIRLDLENQLTAQKTQQFALALIGELRATADIKLLLEES
jgi:FKBP-type peptidyl-prolyl cis-trans isomerase (trigger factor)